MTKDPRPSAKTATSDPLLPKAWGVPQVFRDRLGVDVGRQRLMQADGHLLLVLHAPPQPDDDLRVGRLYWRNAEGDWKPQGISHAEHAIGELIAEYERAADEIDSDEDTARSAEDCFGILTRLSPLVRASHHLHAVLQEARQAAQADRSLILLRDRAYAVSRRLELLQEVGKTTLDYVTAQRAEEQSAAADRQARAAHRLNLLAALFFPIATISSVLGVNLKHGMEAIDSATAPMPFVGLLAVGMTLGVLLAAFVARR